MARVLLVLLGVVVLPASAVGGSVGGRVVFRGEPPGLAPVEVVKDRDACGDSVPSEALVVSARSGGVKWAVVFVEGISRPPEGEPRAATLENRRCRFVPHVGAVQVGGELTIVNADPVLHNLRAWLDAEPRRQAFNVVQPTQGQVTRRTIKRRGVITLTCDTHLHMGGYLLAFDHPYFAVTDDEGDFRIDDLPAGTWRVSAWHEGWAVLRRTPEGRLVWGPAHLRSREVTVPERGVVRVDFELAP